MATENAKRTVTQRAILGAKRTNIKLKNLPMRGIDSEVSGIFSAMASINTENAKRTVTPAKKFLKIGKLTE